MVDNEEELMQQAIWKLLSEDRFKRDAAIMDRLVRWIYVAKAAWYYIVNKIEPFHMYPSGSAPNPDVVEGPLVHEETRDGIMSVVWVEVHLTEPWIRLAGKVIYV
jgi:hypothetical protein